MEVMSRVEENRISGRLAESNPKSSDLHINSRNSTSEPAMCSEQLHVLVSKEHRE